MFDAVLEADQSDDFAGPFAEFAAPLPEFPGGVADHQRSQDVLQKRQFGQQVVELEDKAENPVAKLVAGADGQVVEPFAVEQDFADVGRVEQAQQMQQRALSRAGLADDRKEFALFRADIDAAEHGDFVLALAVGLLDRGRRDVMVFHAQGADARVLRGRALGRFSLSCFSLGGPGKRFFVDE